MSKTNKILVVFLLFIFIAVLVNSITNNQENKKPIDATEYSLSDIVKEGDIEDVEFQEKIEHLDDELNYQERYNIDADYFNFALELFDASMSGNKVAQYYLAKILLSCENMISLRDRYSSSDYSIYETNLQQKLFEKSLEKCFYFDLENLNYFGKSDSWIIKSANNGYAPALIVKLLLSEESSKNENFIADIMTAISSQNSDVMYNISLFFHEATDISVWKLLSCEYGMDCSSSSSEDWIYAMSSRCAIETRIGVYSEWSERCLLGLSLQESIELNHGKEEYEIILQRVKDLKHLIDKDMLSDTLLTEYFSGFNE